MYLIGVSAARENSGLVEGAQLCPQLCTLQQTGADTGTARESRTDVIRLCARWEETGGMARDTDGPRFHRS